MSVTLGAPVALLRSSARLDQLRRELTGEVHMPDEASYDALVTPWNLAVPMRPAAVVAPRTAQDVAALAEWDTGGIWPNFGPPHDANTARRAYDPATLARLVSIARTYDPHGVLQAGSYVRATTV